MNTRYTDNMVTNIKTLTENGKTRGEVAKYMTKKYNMLISRNAIIGKVFRLRAEGNM